MLFTRLLTSASAVLSPINASTRLFSTTLRAEAGYKMKSHSGAKKRWRSLGNGTVYKRAKAYRSHLCVHKGAGRVNKLSTTAYSTHTQSVKLHKKLLPYGSN